MEYEILSVDKNPEKYDFYTFTLNSFYKNLAETQLNETESTRDQALTQLREWIAKDPSIEKCCTEARFLIRFLRLRKFNVVRAYEMLKNYLSMKHIRPEWFTMPNFSDPIMKEILKANAFLPLIEKDEKGRQIIIVRLQNIDTNWRDHDIYRCLAGCAEAILQEEEGQIAGILYVYDYGGLTAGHLGVFNFLNFKNYLQMNIFGAPQRNKGMLVINLPPIFQAFYEITVMMVSQKIMGRIKSFKSLDDFKKVVNIDLFPEEYGGKQKMETIVKHFEEKLAKRQASLLKINEMHLNLAKDVDKEWYQPVLMRDIDTGIIGSFRKLEVD